MLRKIFKGSAILIIISGLILALGTVGASDLDLIDFNLLAIRLVVALILFCIGLYALAVSELS